MANAFLNLARTTRLPVIYRLACAEARIPTESGTFNFASTDSDEQEVLLHKINDCQREILDEFPQLNVVHADLELTPGVRYSLLPEDLRDNDIFSLKWNDGGHRDGEVVTFRPMADVELMGRHWLTDSADYPEYAVQAWDQESGIPKIDWYKMPGVYRTCRMVYRQKEYQFVAADFSLTTGDNICSIPDRMIPLFAMSLGLEFAMLNGADTTASRLMAMREKLLEQWRRKLGAPVASMVNDNLEFGGYPKAHDQYKAYNYNEY